MKTEVNPTLTTEGLPIDRPTDLPTVCVWGGGISLSGFILLQHEYESGLTVYSAVPDLISSQHLNSKSVFELHANWILFRSCARLVKANRQTLRLVLWAIADLT